MNCNQTPLRPLLDVHTHTIASGHAYNTLHEMVTAARERGLQVLGITEHGPSIPGTCSLLYFKNMHIIPRQMEGLRLLLGSEMNILDTRGTLDLDEKYIDMLDLRIADENGGTADAQKWERMLRNVNTKEDLEELMQ